ncbi:hypothetical protein GUJ93_ZPchr0004g38460 [Zizania palustris]|uniref:Uncharacterized protein n=1 Tax=Zizania palustris TaxID=103762 RepID=A0A8J5VYZ6_ZIZPA|nr:hypothetical protein GUJ93_ZPchr0004g38460 [Zizania palustris]
MVKSTSEAELGMDFIEKAFQEATIKVLMGATEGLNTDTLRDPQCYARLEDVSARLPSLVPGVVKVKELLLQLISISQQLQLAHAEFESYSAQKRKELDEAQRELAIHEAPEEKAQFAHRPSEREANGKKWNEAIVEAATGVEKVASNLQVKVTSCEHNVDGLLKSLKAWQKGIEGLTPWAIIIACNLMPRGIFLTRIVVLDLLTVAIFNRHAQS